MQKDKVQEETKNETITEEKDNEAAGKEQVEDSEVQKEDGDSTEKEDELSVLRKELDESKDKHLRLYSEFENFRRRTAKERIELIGSATQELVVELLPVLDDFERAMKAMVERKESPETREGIELVQNKLKKTLENKGLKRMEIKVGDDFNEDFHEAITQIPAEKKLEGKIVDVVETGYYLNEKLIRFAKVVTGAKS